MNRDIDIKNGINFILSHFEEHLFPRKMMTFKTYGQVTVNSPEEVLQRCREANYVDCRINAYPEYTSWRKHEMVRQPPDFVFIDLDLYGFSKYKSPRRMLDMALKNTLNSMTTLAIEHSLRSPCSPTNRSFKESYRDINKINPTVLWTGNGYHIYLPVQAMILDDYEPFSKDKFPNLFSTYNSKYHGYSVSEVFLKFAKDYFTNGKADTQHRPKYKSCLVRILNTYNSKCLASGLCCEESRIKIIQSWDGYRLPMQILTKDFRRWITQEELNQTIENGKMKSLHCRQYRNSDIHQIEWIEKLIQTPLDDCRKYCLWRILCPYLVNVRKLPYEESATLLKEWLQKCSRLNKLNFNSQTEIKYRLRYVGPFLPISKETLKNENAEIYSIFRAKNIISE